MEEQVQSDVPSNEQLLGELYILEVGPRYAAGDVVVILNVFQLVMEAHGHATMIVFFSWEIRLREENLYEHLKES